MSSRTPPLPGAERVDVELAHEPLLNAAIRLARELGPTRPVLGILRGWGRADRVRARALRERLSHQGIRGVELSPVPEAGERHRAPQERRRPRVHLLVHASGSQYTRALRAAALWNLPLLIEPPQHEKPGVLTVHSGHRRPVIGVHLPGAALDIAVRHATITSLQSHPGSASLLLDNEKLAAPADRPLSVTLKTDGSLQVDSDAFGTRRVRRLRYERPWGVCRLDIDGTPAHDVRAPLRFESMPGRLHLLHP
ncbi:hypothetical protein AB0903_33510 [Streptomyces sp. NPDC048389]|uniref:hypothetical protein n=1 Tax=Streptomyces sp. NPDC048389 TaxID=3154622 RepID=UPI00345432E4